ncbi:MAG: AGE family epimerase/isomerase [Lachnospiraceae bacterium]|nr:AGE family epimerase/isomerase [Lachnospiraceae bacterium]
MVDEIRKHLTEKIIPFWKGLRDDEFGGYYGYLGYDLKLDKKAEKGCILNSRITWFFSNAYMVLGEEGLLGEAKHGFEFMREHCFDKQDGGIFWSLNYDGTPLDMTKHTYNQAFGIYALSAYYEASKDEEALSLAKSLFHVIEEKCRDDGGYLEAFTKDFKPESNEKLSENGVMAERTMNTFLHVLEAYTQLYKVSGDVYVKERMLWLLDLLEEKLYNPSLHRQEVFFDKEYHSLIDLHSFGHDIEAAWLVNLALQVLGEMKLSARIAPITSDLVSQVYKEAYDGHSFANECEKGVVNEHRIWWVQAEAIVGFFDAYQRDNSKKEYLEASEHIWEFVKEHVVDKRDGSEWFWEVDKDGKPYPDRPIVEPWKCPYHNGRMCMELIKRNQG